MKTVGWVSHNLDERLLNRMLDYKVELKPYTFEVLDFHSAADYTAKKIYADYKKLYLSFSGGADSEYACRCLIRNAIPFIPIIVITEINYRESSDALATCQELNILPIVIRVDRYRLFKLYLEQVVEKLNGKGFDVVANLITAQYAKSKGGVLIVGEHLMGMEKGINVVCSNEWDFYNDVLCPDVTTVNFFFYTVELFYAMLNDSKNLAFDTQKCDLYGVKPRPKRYYNRLLFPDYSKMLDKLDDRLVPQSLSVYNTALDTLKEFKKFVRN